MPHLVIDQRPIEVEPGTTVLQAAQCLGIALPTLCHVNGFPATGSCSLCVVQIEGQANFLPACALAATEDMVVRTNSSAVREARKMALELLLSDHTGDCIAPCRTGCPARLDIPRFTSLIAQGDYRAAAEVVQDQLVLPASLGRICPHLCEDRCRRRDLEEPLSIRNLHRFCADHHLTAASDTNATPLKESPTGKRVAIVGAGPAGLAAGYHLLRLGHQVVLFDAHSQPGGMLRYGIPEFRLPRSVLDAEIDPLRVLGGEFRLGQSLGRDFALEELRQEYDAVFLAVGAQGSRGLGCPGADLALPAVDLLAQTAEGKPPAIGSEAVVVGGGNTAMDAARTAVRLGASSVKVVYRRSRQEMPCLMEEVEAAEAEGVRVEYLVAPVHLHQNQKSLHLTCQRMELGAPDESGRRRPVPIKGSEFVVAATSVIAAIGQSVHLNAEAAPGLNLSRWGIAANSCTLATNLEGVFVGGDALTGPDLAIRAVAAGKLAAISMDQFLKGQPVTGSAELINVMMGRLDEEELAVLFRKVEQSPRSVMPQLPLDRRRRSFDEVELGLASTIAEREAKRCLGCGCGKVSNCRLRLYSTQYGVDPRRFEGRKRRFERDTSHPDIIFESGKCILCGACVKVALAAGEKLGVSIAQRGFEATLTAPFGHSISEGLEKSARQAAEVCPTGAIALRHQGCAACLLEVSSK